MKNKSQARFRKTIICLIILIGAFSIYFISALESKSIINIEKGDNYTIGNKSIEYNSIWEKYQPIEFKDILGKISFQGALTEHDNICGTNCNSVMDVYMAKGGVLIEDVKFLENNKEVSIVSYQFYIKTGEKETGVIIDDYKWICRDTKKVDINGTIQECKNELIGTHKETIPIWEKYNLNQEVTAGTYEIKLEGEKGFYDTIDWQIKTNGVWLEDWADWGAGGTVTYDGDYVVHTFLTSGYFNVTSSNNIEVLIVAGGGGSGGVQADASGGGGAGGLIYNESYSLSTGDYPVIVGTGGTGGAINVNGTRGGNSSFNNHIAVGGGYGSKGQVGGGENGGNGGSGGGAGGGISLGGTAISEQGFDGASYYGGGGGAGSPGKNGTFNNLRGGGNGRYYSINGSSVCYAGGGGGGGMSANASCGGGDGNTGNGQTNAKVGVNGLGGGGGGVWTSGTLVGKNGGSGIVIIRYYSIITYLNMTGKVVDSNYNIVANAKVLVLDSNGNLIANTTTNSSGDWVYQFIEGAITNYTIIGYNPNNISQGGNAYPFINA